MHNTMKRKEVAVIREVYRKAANRIFFLDYDGTLSPISNIPAEATMTNETREVLLRLAKDPSNEVVIISGRDRFFLDSQFSGIPVTLVAEHGSLIKEQNGEWKSGVIAKPGWNDGIYEILRGLRDAFPGSMIEKKEYAIAWHYRNVKEKPGRDIRLLFYIKTRIIRILYPRLEILRGRKLIEFKLPGISKGKTAGILTERKPYGFILACGDDHTDESIFHHLLHKGFTVKVGRGKTRARMRIPSQAGVTPFLDSLPGEGPKI
jgi:trehalose 6-phosphate synthase/phosphatase